MSMWWRQPRKRMSGYTDLTFLDVDWRFFPPFPPEQIGIHQVLPEGEHQPPRLSASIYPRGTVPIHTLKSKTTELSLTLSKQISSVPFSGVIKCHHNAVMAIFCITNIVAELSCISRIQWRRHTLECTQLSRQYQRHLNKVVAALKKD